MAGDAAIQHINLQPSTGGGEVYTHALTRAFAELGERVALYVHPANRFWDRLAGERVHLVPAEDEAALLARLPRERSLVVTQTPISVSSIERIAQQHLVAGFAHMPAFGRGGEGFGAYRYVASVSRYCIELLRAAGIAHVHPEPMYGVADAARGDPRAAIVRGSPYLWDRRKGRDRLFAALQPLVKFSFGEKRFERRPGLTLGIVSLLMPIKQFPLLFSGIAPILARHGVNLEIFGAGGYAQVRDLRRALAPLGHGARFWGYQENVAAVYPKLDYLLTGLPEKEALGLNVLEAQACGTPVLAPRGGPFPESVLEGASGFLYRDPREDGGADFDRLLARLAGTHERPDPRAAREHLAQFSWPAFVERASRFLGKLRGLSR